MHTKQSTRSRVLQTYKWPALATRDYKCTLWLHVSHVSRKHNKRPARAPRVIQVYHATRTCTTCPPSIIVTSHAPQCLSSTNAAVCTTNRPRCTSGPSGTATWSSCCNTHCSLLQTVSYLRNESYYNILQHFAILYFIKPQVWSSLDANVDTRDN